VNQQQDNQNAVRYLVELGYVDPHEVALRESALRSQLEGELQQSLLQAQQGHAADAIVSLNRLVRDDPEWIAPHELLAQIHFQLANVVEARNELRWLECHGCESPRLSLMASRLAIAERDFKSAIEHLDYSTHVAPELPAGHALYGEALRRLNQPDAAEEAFRRALAQNAADAHSLDGLAAISLSRGDFEAAAEWALSALEANMQLVSAHWHLGRALEQMGRPNDALAAFQACHRADPRRLAPLRRLTYLAVKLNNPANAEVYRELARTELSHRRQRRELSQGSQQ